MKPRIRILYATVSQNGRQTRTVIMYQSLNESAFHLFVKSKSYTSYAHKDGFIWMHTFDVLTAFDF